MGRGRQSKGRWRCAVVVTLMVFLPACNGDDEAQPEQKGPTTSRLALFAPPPLRPALDAVTKAFESANTGVTVTHNYGHLPSLISQLRGGVRGDVIATPDEASMRQLQERGMLIGPPQTFARTLLAIAVPTSNPGRVSGLADLARPELKVAICDPSLPCGQLTQRVLGAAGVKVDADTLEIGVEAIMTKVVTGEVDAGVVYATNLRANEGRVQGVQIPGAENAAANLQVGTLVSSSNRTRAAQLIAFLTSKEAGRILEHHGLLPA